MIHKVLKRAIFFLGGERFELTDVTLVDDTDGGQAWKGRHALKMGSGSKKPGRMMIVRPDAVFIPDEPVAKAEPKSRTTRKPSRYHVPFGPQEVVNAERDCECSCHASMRKHPCSIDSCKPHECTFAGCIGRDEWEKRTRNWRMS